MLIAAIFIASCSVFLAIPATIVAIRSVRKNAKITYATISAVLVVFAAVLVVWALLRTPLDFTAAAPVPSSLTMYFAQNDLGSGTTLHADMQARAVKDGASRFVHAFPLRSDTTALGADVYSDGVVYTDEVVNTNTNIQSGTLFAMRASDGSVIWQKSLASVLTAGGYYPRVLHFVMDGVIYIASVDSTDNMIIHALRTSDGSELWVQSLSSQAGSEAMTAANGILYLDVYNYLCRACD